MPDIPKKKFYKALEAKSLRSRSTATQLADHLTAKTGTPLFLFGNAAIFMLWIVYNSGLVPGVIPFDPYPYGLLTMAVSLEAIFLSIFVLVSQNRAAQIATLREEVHMRINLIAEQEITKILELLVELRKKQGITKEDPELEEMLRAIDTSSIERSISQQLERADKSMFEGLLHAMPTIIETESKKESK